MYACFLSRTFRSTQSIRNYISGIKTWHKLLNFDTSSFQDIELKLTLQGLDKTMAHLPHPGLPILPHHLSAIKHRLDLSSPFDATIWASIIVSFFAFLRKSNLVPPSISSFNPREQLCRSDFRFVQQGLLIQIQWSKSRQHHDHMHVIPVSALPQSELCPLWAYCHMLALQPASASSPAFSVIRSGHLVPLTQHVLRQHFRRLVSDIGLNPVDYSFHSLRRGGATVAAMAGIPDSLIRTQGDWRSMVYKDYISIPATERFHVTAAMGDLMIS